MAEKRTNCYFCSKKLKENEIVCSKCGQSQKKSQPYLILLGSVVAFWLVIIVIFTPLRSYMPKISMPERSIPKRITYNTVENQVVESSSSDENLNKTEKKSILQSIIGNKDSGSNDIRTFLTNIGLDESDIQEAIDKQPLDKSDELYLRTLKLDYGIYSDEARNAKDIRSFLAAIGSSEKEIEEIIAEMDRSIGEDQLLRQVKIMSGITSDEVRKARNISELLIAVGRSKEEIDFYKEMKPSGMSDKEYLNNLRMEFGALNESNTEEGVAETLKSFEEWAAGF